MHPISSKKVHIVPSLQVLEWRQEGPMTQPPQKPPTPQVVDAASELSTLKNLVRQLVILVQTPREYWTEDEEEAFTTAREYAKAQAKNRGT